MAHVLSITELMAGIKVLGGRIARSVRGIRIGVPYKALESAREAVGLSREEVCTTLGIPPRTLAWRKRASRLTAQESDRMYRLAHVLAKAVTVLRGSEKAARWLRKPNRALGDASPLSRLDTEVGTRQVEAVLGRLEHGVFS